jgi:hypothetical protein
MALLDRLLGRLRRSHEVEPGPRPPPPPLARSNDDDDEERDLEEGALDPDELEGDPFVWDEGADDELD